MRGRVPVGGAEALRLSAESGRPLRALAGVATWPPLVALFLLTTLLTTPLAAQSRITTSVDTTRATVGDRITMTVTVEHPSGAEVAWPDSLDVAPFEVVQARLAQPTQVDGTTSSTATFTLTAFELGALEIPGFEVEVVGPDGAAEVLSTDAWGVELVSVGVDEGGEIRDIRGPLGIPMSLLRMLLLILVPLLILALLYTVARRLRSRDEDEPRPALPTLERPAHEIALESLAALEASGMLERGEVKEYHIEVSDILRTYVERRFHVDALEMTTREVLVGLEGAGVDESFRDGLAAFLDQCDMVKFARGRPGPEQARQVLELGRRIVQRSAPEAEAEPPESLDAAAPAEADYAAAGERPESR
ncbi:MAG TPA: BatD family protein [Longimicrobiales bacterium]|nr:BatD family protein [Longimicrobiales bacterium]